MIDRGAHVSPSSYLTADVPGIGGRIKSRPEDFLVDEIPLYDPCGSGEHIYLYVEKRNLAAMELVGVLAKHFGVRREAIGCAGLKDKLAITRQVVSIHTPGRTSSDFPSIKHENIAVLWSDQHNNKLRRGHLKGNRFSIRIREVSPTAVLAAKRVLDKLEKLGVPNRFGEQRFGFLGNNHLVGAALIRGDFDTATRELFAPDAPPDEDHAKAKDHFLNGRYREAKSFFPPQARTERSVLSTLESGKKPKQAWYNLPSDVRVFYLNAWQSAVFNAVLDRRLAAGTFASLRAGDLAMKHENRAVFAVDQTVLDDSTTAGRLASLEISPSGPMWGPTMARASGEIDALEVEALKATGVTLEDLQRFATADSTPLEGARRPLRVPLMYPDVEGGVDEHGSYVRVGFELPRGSFATVVLREIMKPRTGMDADEGSES